MKLILVINFLVLLSIACGKPKHEDPHLAAEEDDPDMQNDEYQDYDDDSNDDGDEEDDITPEILSKGQIFVVNKHDSVLLPCDIIGNNVVVTMWRKNEDILFQDKIQLRDFDKNKYSLNNTSLFVRDIDENDVGEYSCNLVMTDNPPKIVHVIHLKTPANILNMNAEKNVNEYKVGDTLVLTCNATGEPEPNITWSIAGKRLSTTGKTLIIEKLAKDNAGHYQCLAENGIGQPAHQSILIKINHKPIVHIEKTINFNDGEDYNVELKCNVDSHPKSIVTWRKNGEVIREGTYKHRNKNNLHTLTIMHVKENDYGKFTCVAENQVGKSESHYVFTDKPSQPIYQSGGQIDDNRVVYLVWDVESLYPIEDHLLMYKKKDTTEWIQEHPEVTNGNRYTYTINHTITNLEHGEYIVKVKSKNKSGWSEESKETKFSGPKHKHHHGNKNHYVYDKANDHSIQVAPEIAQTRLEETAATDSSPITTPTSIIYLAVLTLLFSRRNI